jgi:hypothetical protein
MLSGEKGAASQRLACGARVLRVSGPAERAGRARSSPRRIGRRPRRLRSARPQTKVPRLEAAQRPEDPPRNGRPFLEVDVWETTPSAERVRRLDRSDDPLPAQQHLRSTGVAERRQPPLPRRARRPSGSRAAGRRGFARAGCGPGRGIALTGPPRAAISPQRTSERAGRDSAAPVLAADEEST